MTISAGGLMVTAGLALFLYAAWTTLSCKYAQLYLQNLPCEARARPRIKLCSLADRDMLKLTQQEFEGVPLLVKAEVLIASVVCMWGRSFDTLLSA